MDSPPLDRIYIRDLTARCIIGLNPEERVQKQEVIINITMHADLGAAGVSDAIEDTVDYKQVKKDILSTVEKSECLLLEKLAEEVAQIALGPGKVKRVEVVIDKPGALRFARSVAVEITRSKGAS